jgi:4'-phosphopantetheinyl transferase
MGKPEIADPRADEKWTFNLSHTRGLVACVVARTSRVGIDVEWAERRRSYPALARRVLAPAELRDFEALAAADRKRRFLDYWTLKEAHLKARGTGLRTHLAGLEFRLLPGDGAACVADSAASPVEGDWHYLRLRPTPLHLLAVAFANTRPPRWEVKEADA